jgi:hypothetical protein
MLGMTETRELPQVHNIGVRHGRAVHDMVECGIKTSTDRYETSAGNDLATSILASCKRLRVSIGRRDPRIQRKQHKQMGRCTSEVW